MSAPLVCLLALLAIYPVMDASGELRTYVDEKGTVHLTDKEDGPEEGSKPVEPSSGTMYQYLDERGRPHMTNDKSRILPQYLGSVRTIKGGDKRSESQSALPANPVDAFRGDRENTWLKYKQLGWFEKNALIAKAGFSDLKGVFDDLKVQLLFITLLFIGMGVYAIIKLKKVSHMVSVIGLLISCYGMVYLAMHIKSSMGRGSDILSNLKQMQSLTQGQPAAAGGEGGILGSLKNLQDMSAERQDLFKMILEED